MKNILRSVVVVCMIANVVWGCKSEEGFSGYMILPLRENVEPAPETESVYETPNDLIVHIFMDVEGTGWRAMSFEDAQAGILTDTVGGIRETLDPNASFTQNADGNIELGSFQGGRRHFLIACDRQSGSYAWRELRTAGNAGTIFLSLIFRPWRLRENAAATYTEFAWTMANPIRVPDPVEPVEPVEPE